MKYAIKTPEISNTEKQ